MKSQHITHTHIQLWVQKYLPPPSRDDFYIPATLDYLPRCSLPPPPLAPLMSAWKGMTDVEEQRGQGLQLLQQRAAQRVPEDSLPASPPKYKYRQAPEGRKTWGWDVWGGAGWSGAESSPCRGGSERLREGLMLQHPSQETGRKWA